MNTNLSNDVDFLQSIPAIHAKKYSHDVSTLPGTNLSIVDLTVTLIQQLPTSRSLGGSGSSSSSGGTSGGSDTFLPQSFIDKHNLELLCTPVSFMSGTDVSGQSGIVTLTSPALLKIKPRSLVIYMKYSRSETDYKVSFVCYSYNMLCIELFRVYLFFMRECHTLSISQNKLV